MAAPLPADAWRSLGALTAAVSPDGAYLALTYLAETLDPAERHRVHVHEVASGEAVCCLDDAGDALAVRWTSPTRLLVFRRVSPSREALTLHELPDGGCVGRFDPPVMLGHPCWLLASDGARLVVSSNWTSTLDAAGNRVYALDVPSLALRSVIDCAALGAALQVRLRVGDQCALHPDGHHLAMHGRSAAKRAGAIAMIPIDRPERAWLIEGLRGSTRRLFWLGASTLVHGSQDGSLTTIDCRPPGAFHHRLLPDVRVSEVYAAHPDRERVLVKVRATSDPPQPSSAPRHVDHVAVVNAVTGAWVQCPGQPQGWYGVPCLSPDGRAAAYTGYVADPWGDTAFTVVDLETRRLARRAVPRPSFIHGLQGGRVLMLTVAHDRSGHRVTREFIDPEALLANA